MTDDAEIKRVAVTLDEAGLFLAEAVQIMGTLQAACLQDERDGADLPRGMLTCGQACRMTAAVVVMALHLYPALTDEGVLETLFRNALTAGTTGAVQ